ncbi:MAG: hypothetical protein H7244_12720, partial [Herminiimonas sp.]|nr:hypothetical protein [Herminiimonas sp.]
MPVPKKRPSAKLDAVASTATSAEKLADKLARLGLRSDMDLVLHLPLRYEDEI